MEKWADYLISAVHYQYVNSKRFISKLRVHLDNGEQVESNSEWSREMVIELTDQGKTFKTIFRNSAQSWNKGEDVRKLKINSNYYLKTVSNNKEEDNLENLPEF